MGHAEARKILVLEQFGEVGFMGFDWWADVLELVPLPLGIDELWLCETYVDNHDVTRIFEPLLVRK
jgi:hypothetical protein